MSRRQLLTAALFVLCSVPSTAPAYDPHIHETIAARAVETFRACESGDRRVVAIADAGWLAIAAASRAEDGASWTRLVNWHFVNRSIDSAPYWRIAEMSLVPLFRSVAEELAAAAGNDRFELIGRVLHYVEDVTVPAHVVPAYHGPRAPGMGLERGGFVIKDEVDDYPKTDPQVWADLDKAGICGEAEKMARAHPAVVELLQRVADGTRTAIAEPVPGAAAVTWKSLFWVDPEDGEFFGRYNVPVYDRGELDCANGPGGYFGAESVCGPAGRPLRIRTEVYRDFVRSRLRAAILGDVAVLYQALAPAR